MKLARSFFWRVYLALVAALLLFALLSAAWWRLSASQDSARHQRTAQLAGDIAVRLLPPADAGMASLREALEDWHRRAGVDLAVFDANGQLLAATGRPIELSGGADSGFFSRGRYGPLFVAPLPDGRRIALRPPPRDEDGGGIRRWPGFVFMLLMAALAVALVSYPIARRLTGRIERLERGVDALGKGDLSARVRVEGHDEIATLAASFNRSAQRIESLMQSQRSLLANASHELRSPLARIRMGLALLPEQTAVDLRHELARDIDELDQLIDEILLASRLQAEQPGPGLNALASADRSSEPLVDLVALCAEECARVDAQLELPAPEQAVSVHGDARLLRRLVRNLLENARRHGQAPGIALELWRNGANEICLAVSDNGPGVPAEERERIFEPFYRARGASERQGGVGLGLSLARQIAERHDATIVCEARPAGGSRFLVRFGRAATARGSASQVGRGR